VVEASETLVTKVSKASEATVSKASEGLVPAFLAKKMATDCKTVQRVDTEAEPESYSERDKTQDEEVVGTKKKIRSHSGGFCSAEGKPGYELYICGHSLGGALATVFAFEAAAANDDLIPKPVTCITTGSPKIGNLAFVDAFEVSNY
jgi:Lipase (class 3)